MTLLKGQEATSWPSHTTPPRAVLGALWIRAEGISYCWDRACCRWCWSGGLVVVPAPRPRSSCRAASLILVGAHGSLRWMAVAGCRAAVAVPGRRSPEGGSRCRHTALVWLSGRSSLRLPGAHPDPHTSRPETSAQSRGRRQGAPRGRAGCAAGRGGRRSRWVLPGAPALPPAWTAPGTDRPRPERSPQSGAGAAGRGWSTFPVRKAGADQPGAEEALRTPQSNFPVPKGLWASWRGTFYQGLR